MNRTRYWIGALLIFLAAFCFACKGILIKLAYAYHIDSVSLLTLRMLFAMPFYVVIALKLARTGPTAPLSFRQWGGVALFGITGYYLASLFNFIGLAYVSASLERILLFIYPTFVLLLNAVGFGRRVTRLQVLALLLTYTGILLAFVDNLGTSDQKNLWLGTFWVVLSGLVYAVYLVGSDRMIPLLGSLRFTCYAMLAATVPTVLHCALQNGLKLTAYPAPVYGLAAAMAVFVTVIPTFMMAEGIKRIGSGNASIIGSIGPIFTILLATLVLHETIGLPQLVGTGFVLTGVFLIGARGHK